MLADGSVNSQGLLQYDMEQQALVQSIHIWTTAYIRHGHWQASLNKPHVFVFWNQTSDYNNSLYY